MGIEGIPDAGMPLKIKASRAIPGRRGSPPPRTAILRAHSVWERERCKCHRSTQKVICRFCPPIGALKIGYLVASSALLHHRCKAASTQAKGGLDVTRDSHSSALCRDSISITDHPHSSRTIVNLVHASAKRSPRGNHISRNGNFAISEPCRIAVDVGNRFSRRTSGGRQHYGDHSHGNSDLENNLVSIHSQAPKQL